MVFGENFARKTVEKVQFRRKQLKSGEKIKKVAEKLKKWRKKLKKWRKN